MPTYLYARATAHFPLRAVGTTAFTLQPKTPPRKMRTGQQAQHSKDVSMPRLSIPAHWAGNSPSARWLPKPFYIWAFRLKCHSVECVGQEPDHVQIDFTAISLLLVVKTLKKKGRKGGRKGKSKKEKVLVITLSTFHSRISHHFTDTYIFPLKRYKISDPQRSHSFFTVSPAQAKQRAQKSSLLVFVGRKCQSRDPFKHH